MSLTEKCNLGCYFCHNEGQGILNRRKPMLTPDDFVWTSKTAHKYGYRKFKLTGGEPTLNPGIFDIIKGMSYLPDSDLSMITNGSRLETISASLREAGLKRLNVSLYTLDSGKFKTNNGGSRKLLERIINGIITAIEAGFSDIKLNYIWDETSTVEDFTEICHFAAAYDLTIVLLPVMKSNNNFDIEETALSELYELVKTFGIAEEKVYRDNEGIQKRLITLTDGTKILLRDEELKNKLPFNKCKGCRFTRICREGIFPVRLSAFGEILPCLGDNSQRFEAGQIIKNRDEESLLNIFEQVESL